MAAHTDTSPARGGFAVTPSDVTTFPVCRALYIGVSGDVRVDFIDSGTNVLLKGAPVGALPVQVTRVYSTGTTATDIVRLV
jgi:hypothetical protein